MTNRLIRHFLFICIMVGINNQLLGQDFYPDLIQQAYQKYDSANYTAACELFSKAFKRKRKPPLSDLYGYACCENLRGNEKKAIAILIKLAKLGFTDAGFKKDADLASLKTQKAWGTLVTQIEKNKANMEAGYDRDLMKQLNEIYHSDQKYRKKLDSVYRTDFNNIELKRSFSDSIMKYDSINLAKIEDIIAKHGWPGKGKVGEIGNLAVFAVIQHSSLEIQERYLPSLLKSIKAKQSPMSFKALLIDRISIKKGQKQVYGTQTQFNSVTKKMELLPVKNIHKMDKLRSRLGLVSSKLYLKEINGE
jgi:hypothetical protein